MGAGIGDWGMMGCLGWWLGLRAIFESKIGLYTTGGDKSNVFIG